MDYVYQDGVSYSQLNVSDVGTATVELDYVGMVKIGVLLHYAFNWEEIYKNRQTVNSITGMI